MSEVPADLRYTDQHEYIKATDEPDVFTVGITDYAQGELGDVVFVSLPAVGDVVEAGGSFGTIEAVKAVSELYSPADGEIVGINETLDADPSLVNQDPYGEGWMIKLKVNSPEFVASQLDAEAYKAHIGES